MSNYWPYILYFPYGNHISAIYWHFLKSINTSLFYLFILSTNDQNIISISTILNLFNSVQTRSPKQYSTGVAKQCQTNSSIAFVAKGKHYETARNHTATLSKSKSHQPQPRKNSKPINHQKIISIFFISICFIRPSKSVTQNPSY